MAGRRLEAAQQVARAHAELLGDALDGRVLVETALQQVLDPADSLVGERHHAVARLQAAGQADEQRLGALQRNVAAAELVDQVETQVDGRVPATAAEQTPVLGDEVLRLPQDLGIALPEHVRHAPVGGGTAAVEQPGFRQEGDAAAHAAEERAARMCGAEPKHQRRLAYDAVLGIGMWWFRVAQSPSPRPSGPSARPSRAVGLSPDAVAASVDNLWLRRALLGEASELAVLAKS